MGWITHGLVPTNGSGSTTVPVDTDKRQDAFDQQWLKDDVPPAPVTNMPDSLPADWQQAVIAVAVGLNVPVVNVAWDAVDARDAWDSSLNDWLDMSGFNQDLTKK